MQIDQPDFWLDKEILLKGINDPVVEAYNNYQVDLAVLYGADRSRAEVEMTEALNFEIALANVSQCYQFILVLLFMLPMS